MESIIAFIAGVALPIIGGAATAAAALPVGKLPKWVKPVAKVLNLVAMNFGNARNKADDEKTDNWVNRKK